MSCYRTTCNHSFDEHNYFKMRTSGPFGKCTKCNCSVWIDPPQKKFNPYYYHKNKNSDDDYPYDIGMGGIGIF